MNINSIIYIKENLSICLFPFTKYILLGAKRLIRKEIYHYFAHEGTNEKEKGAREEEDRHMIYPL